MSELKPFAGLDDFTNWENDTGDGKGRACPRCGEDATQCSCSLHEMRQELMRRKVGEVRVTDPNTGGQKGQKLERFDLIPVEPLLALARLYGRGAQKYADDNWRRGYSWRLSIGAAFRHFAKWLMREAYDTEDGQKGGPIALDAQGKPVHTGEHHLICVAWHCFTLIMFELHGLGTDDRAATVEP